MTRDLAGKHAVEVFQDGRHDQEHRVLGHIRKGHVAPAGIIVLHVEVAFGGPALIVEADDLFPGHEKIVCQYRPVCILLAEQIRTFSVVIHGSLDDKPQMSTPVKIVKAKICDFQPFSVDFGLAPALVLFVHRTPPAAGIRTDKEPGALPGNHFQHFLRVGTSIGSEYKFTPGEFLFQMTGHAAERLSLAELDRSVAVPVFQINGCGADGRDARKITGEVLVAIFGILLLRGDELVVVVNDELSGQWKLSEHPCGLYEKPVHPGRHVELVCRVFLRLPVRAGGLEIFERAADNVRAGNAAFPGPEVPRPVDIFKTFASGQVDRRKRLEDIGVRETGTWTPRGPSSLSMSFKIPQDSMALKICASPPKAVNPSCFVSILIMSLEPFCWVSSFINIGEKRHFSIMHAMLYFTYVAGNCTK